MFIREMIKMISYAFRTSEREEDKAVRAIDCTGKEKGVRFFCPNDDCDAHMFICNLDNPDIKPYFRATTKLHPHVDSCQFAKLKFKLEDYFEEGFDFDRATERVMKPSRTGQETPERTTTYNIDKKKLPPHTIKQIYELAKSNNLDYSYNSFKMWQLLADKRSAHIYHKGLFRSCLVEATFAGYKADRKFIRMKYFLNDSDCHYIRLYFNDEEVFNKCVDKILEARPSPVIVWGEWKSIDYYFKAIIYSLNQLYVP